MNFIEAAQKARDTGCAIRRPIWGANVRVVANELSETVLASTSRPYGDIFGILADDWEIVEEAPKQLTFLEAVAEMKQGKKARRLEWPDRTLTMRLDGPWFVCNGISKALCCHDIEA